jgi:hypothetical protein
MPDDSDRGTDPRRDRNLLLGVWVVVCVAVLITAALL